MYEAELTHEEEMEMLYDSLKSLRRLELMLSRNGLLREVYRLQVRLYGPEWWKHFDHPSDPSDASTSGSTARSSCWRAQRGGSSN